MRKKCVWRITVCLYVFLVLCTLASIQVQRLILPQVEVAQAMPGTVRVEGMEVSRDYTIPITALEKCGEDYAVYYLQERDGRFGKEQYVMRMGIQVTERDDHTAALSSQGYGKIVVRTNRPLADGMRVLCYVD